MLEKAGRLNPTNMQLQRTKYSTRIFKNTTNICSKDEEFEIFKKEKELLKQAQNDNKSSQFQTTMNGHNKNVTNNFKNVHMDTRRLKT